MAYRGFNIINPATAPTPPQGGWGTQEMLNWNLMADTVCADTLSGAADSTGHKHVQLYDTLLNPAVQVSGAFPSSICSISANTTNFTGGTVNFGGMDMDTALNAYGLITAKNGINSSLGIECAGSTTIDNNGGMVIQGAANDSCFQINNVAGSPLMEVNAASSLITVEASTFQVANTLRCVGSTDLATLNISSLSSYANNAAAHTGGLIDGDVYINTTIGALMVVTG